MSKINGADIQKALGRGVGRRWIGAALKHEMPELLGMTRKERRQRIKFLPTRPSPVNPGSLAKMGTR